MKKTACAMILFIFLASAAEASKNSDVRAANRLYGEGKYDESLKKYQDILKGDPESDIINFNAGASFYKTEDYEEAVNHFRKALLGKDDQLKADAYYNLGNSLYKWGMTKEEPDLESAVQLLENSLKEYEKSLALSPEDQVVQSNRAYVSKELERLKKKLQKQKQEQKQQNKTCPMPKKDQQKSGEKKGQKDQQKSGGQNEQKKNSGGEKKEGNNGEKKENQENGSSNDREKNHEKTSKASGQEDRGRKPDASASAQDSGSKLGGQEQDQSGRPAGMSQGQNVKASAGEGKEMTDQEYRMFLKDYQQNEEPRGLLNMQPRSSKTRQTDKDW